MVRGLDANSALKFLFVGLAFLFAITSVINFSFFTSEDPNAELIKDVEFLGNCDVASGSSSQTACENAGGNWSPGLIPNVFTIVIVGMAVFLAWRFGLGFTGRLDRKAFLSMIIMGVVLYFLWTFILQPSGLVNIQPIEFSAVKLQAMVP